jgi:acyl carrier protein
VLSNTPDDAVVTAVIDALGLEPDEVTPDARLIEDLGAESIDLLDMLFRIERALGVKVHAGELIEEIQGGIPEEEFGDERGIITAKGLAHLKTVMPQIDTDELAGKLEAEKVITLFTVQNLSDVVARRSAVAVSADG